VEGVGGGGGHIVATMMVKGVEHWWLLTEIMKFSNFLKLKFINNITENGFLHFRTDFVSNFSCQVFILIC